jgi:hypothetical protein
MFISPFLWYIWQLLLVDTFIGWEYKLQNHHSQSWRWSEEAYQTTESSASDQSSCQNKGIGYFWYLPFCEHWCFPLWSSYAFYSTQQEENILLKRQNAELSAKLQQLGAILTRTKEELARYRVSNGKDPYEQIEEEELLRKKLDVRLLSTNLSKSCASCEDWWHWYTVWLWTGKRTR